VSPERTRREPARAEAGRAVPSQAARAVGDPGVDELDIPDFMK
jgi:hypothetical protein